MKAKHGVFLLPASEFAGFDYVYIGDVDFLIIKETRLY